MKYKEISKTYTAQKAMTVLQKQLQRANRWREVNHKKKPNLEQQLK